MSSRIQDFDKLSPAKQKLLLARLRKREEAEARSEGIPRSPRREEGGPFPLSFAQQRLWFIDRLDPGAATYNLSDALLLEGRLDVPALERTLGEIVRRHEALRTVFDEVEGKAVQWIAPPDDRSPRVPLPIIDLSGLDAERAPEWAPERAPERADTEARRLAEAEAAQPFDVPRGPHLRARLVRLPSAGHERWLALLSMHHIVADGWSMGVLVRELGTLYASFAAGAPASLPELPIQYPDFADWQRRTLQGETLEEHLRWWRERLAGAPPTLDLPADRPRPPVARHQGANFQAPLPADLSAALADLARQRGATPFMVLLASFALLLARHSGQDDVVIGSPVANRNRLETEGLIGFFVNTLVLRVDAAERPGRTFLDLLDEVRGTTLGAYAHQDLPFDRIVEELRPERDLSRPPLFQVSLIWQNAPSGALHLPGLTLDGLHLPARTSLVDLSVEAAERADGIAADWRYDTDLFEERTVRRFAERFEVLLRAVMAAPDRPLLDLPTLSEAEQEVLAGWGCAKARFPGEESLPTLLARQAASASEALAIEVTDGERITYQDLWNRVLRLARRLRALGVGPEVCVGICLERSIDQVVAALAVIQAGGAYVPLDPGHPRERLALLLEDTKAPLVLTLEPLLPSLPEISAETSVAQVLCLDRDRAEIEREPAEPFDSGALSGIADIADTLAYVMYTSGSTGTPKGVAIPHRGIARLARWGSEIGIGPEDRVLLFAPFAFDASTLEIWGALLNGARLIVPPAGPASLEEIGGWVERHGVTVLWLTAGLFHQMADSKPGGPLDRLGSLRFLMAGGDVLSVPHVRQVLQRLPGTVLVNGYGPTENTTFTSCHLMQGPRTFVTSVPVGRAIVGTRIVVLDRAGRPVPAGVAGELCTGGAGLARGYFGRPDLTAEAFVPDAWSGQPGERLYRTGDLARFLADGPLEILGRIDQQVKIRGFRIEPGEVESALAGHPEVGACSVVVGRDAAGKRLIACLSPRDPSAPPAVSALREWLGERLPAPMIPSAFLILDTLPLTANGKVDRRALLRLLPEPGGAGDAGPGEAPRTEVERRLAALWADLLGGAPAGVRSDFFALGGHSLLATQLVSRVRETFGIEIPLRTVFEAPTLEGLASRIERAAKRAPLLAPSERPIERVAGEGPFPLSFAQERLWLLDQIEPGSSAYNMPAALRLAGQLRPGLLATVLGEIVRRHAALRTSCVEVDGAPAQVVAPEAPFVLPLVDLAGLPAEEGEEEARRLASDEALRPFDLSRGPMLRALLLRLPADHLLLCTMHHIASDGWSVGVFVREILALYGALSQGHPSPLPELPVRYVDYAVWQRKVLQGKALDEGLAYWRRELAGVPALDLAALDVRGDRPWHPGAGAGAGLESFVLPAVLTRRLKDLGQSEGATLFMVLLAAFQALLARFTGQADFAVGTPVAGRDRAELEGLIGFFVNTLVMRADLGGNPGFRELLARVRESALAAFAHQQIPFEKLVAELSPERSLARTPFFQVMFALMNGGGPALEIPGLAITPFETGAGAAKFDLTLSLREVEGELACNLEYRAALFDAGTIRRLRDRFEALLAEVVEDPERPLFEMPLGATERAARLPRAPRPAGTWEAPRTPVESRLAELWSKLLGTGPVGVWDDFFHLGGHSLLGTQLVSQVREVFGVELPLRALFEDPTLGGLAARIEEMSGEPGTSDAPVLPPIPRVPRDGQPLPLSFAQERLWLLDELDPGTPTLNMPFAARLSEPLEDATLARALGEVARRHESLRTTFGSDGGRPFQRIAPFHPVPLPVIDLRGLAPDPRRDEARRLEAEESLAPFDLARGPLLRARLIRMRETDRLLLITFHHAISDGWSLGLLMRELTALYRAFAAGLPSPLPELPIQYADYAAWQRRWLTGEALEGQIAYWRAQLGDPAKPLPVLDLPTDRPRPAVQSWRGAALTHPLDPGLTGRLGALAQREGATLFMVLLAGFQALLARWSGQEDLVVGTPVAGRLRAETEGLIGCFLNNLALRTDLSGSPSFRALLGRVRATALEAYAHQDVSFEKLLEELRVERDLSRTPLFQVFLNMLNFPAEEGALGGDGEEAGPPEVPSKFDLTIYATETTAGLRLDLVYNADLFDRPRMAELAAQLELLLARAADDPETRIGEIPLLTAAARAVLPNPAQPLQRAWLGAVPARVSEHARRHPGAPALVDRAGIWTYGQLDAHAGRLASRLRAAGIGTGEVVAVFAHRGAALAAALLGIWRSGAAFALLDPAYPPARLAAILDLARPGAFLRLEAAGAPPAEVEERVREIPRLALPEREEGWRALGEETDPGIESVEGIEIGPDDLAYVAFTSGSTGTPKGILGTHAPLSHFFDWHARTFRLAADDLFSVLSGLAHDPLLRDLFAPLWIGAALHVPDPDEMGDSGRLAAWMARERVTVAHLTPALGQLLAQGPAAGAGGLPDLRRAFFGGDVLTPADLTRLARLAPRAEVVNFYGATETPQAMGWWGEGMREAGAVPLGRGIEGVQLLVLNPAGHLAGIGEIGEIAIRTPYLAVGYLGDPAATAERFLADPFAGGGEVRAYRTGDLGRYRPDGALTFAGRADAQIKIRGFRVETGEIEAALARHPAVREAAVTLAEGPDRQLLAFVILDPAVEAPDLRSWLRGQLPSYMLPAAILLLERLPLTPNRKVDRRALARIAGELIQPAAAKAGERPRNPVEETLASLWGELLGTDPERIGIHQDFFDLGGHSLLAAQLLARLWDRFEVELPLRALFEWPTIAGMAELVAKSASPASVTPPLVRRDPADEPPPLSFAQQRLWFLHQLDPASPAYNLPSALRLSGPLDADALARAFSEVTRRHEVLRTRYAALDGAPVQVIDPPRESRTALPRVDLSGLPEEAREAEAAAWVRRESRAPFDLALDHPLRARLLRLGPADHVLALTLHHIASDGWSNGLLVRELAELYRAVAAGRPASLPDLPFQYADFAVWQRRAFDAGALDGQRAYWREHLGTPPPPLELPTDRPRPAVPTYAGAQRGIELPEDLAAALANLGRSRGATLFMTLLAGWAALLSRYSGQDDLTIGTPVAGRTRVEIEPLIGFFVNTLVIRADLSGDPPFADLLDRVREASLGAFGHQDLPFEELVEELRPERDLSHPPLFQVMFVLQNATPEALEVAGLAFRALSAESGAATFDLTLALSGDGGRRLGGMLQYKTDLFEAATIDRLLGHFRVLLAAAAARPEERLDDLPLLTPAERGQLLGTWNDSWNDTAVTWPDDLCLHELFERQVDRAPEATALVVAETGEEVSYGELDARAGRLAGWLRAHGVGPEVSVGVALERSPELVVALLAVLKAGGAWVPLDPSYPPDRLSFLIEDAAVAVLLSRNNLPAGNASAPARLASGVTPDHLAYRIYTSGSTGRPKAVLVPHRAIVNHMRWLQKDWPLGPSDVMLQTLSVSFDASFFDLWAPLLAGARLVLPAAESPRDAARLAEDIARFGVTRYGNVPPWLAEMVERPAFAAAPALRQVITGGQEFPGALAERLAASGRQVVNFYGPSEAAVTATAWLVTPGSGERIVPIGRPIANVHVHVLGSAAEPLPAGVPGELCIGGAGVARGYGGRPDLTADRFRPDPFSEAGARLYRTGDRARWRADGVLEFLGRVDRQVKVRGFRIEPGEIEAVLARHPQIREAAVVARRAGAGDLRLVAYAVVRQPVQPEDLRTWLAARLPEPMLPAFWVFLETLPRTPNGKVDLAALPEPERVLSVEGQDRVAPRDALERELAAIWEELLDVRPVGVRDDFFTLGGHSLLVLRLLARIEKSLGRTLSPATIFAAPTIEELARLLRGEAEVAPGRLVRLHPGGDKPPLVWVHATAGTVTAYAEVARRLREADPDRPVWALQIAAPLPESLEALAAGHVSALREAWPAGPYQLAGWSFGGVVAFEMARQLQDAGAEVALLALVDTRAPGAQEIPRDLPSLLATFAADQGLPADLDLADQEALRPLFETFREHLALLASYGPAAYPGRVVLFRATESPVPAPPALGWEPLVAGELEIQPLPGDHAGVIRGEGAGRLVAEILARLA